MFCLSSYLRDALCLRPLFSAQLLRNEIGSAESDVEVGVSAYSIMQSKQLSDKVSNKSLFALFMVPASDLCLCQVKNTSTFELPQFAKPFHHHLQYTLGIWPESYLGCDINFPVLLKGR